MASATLSLKIRRGTKAKLGSVNMPEANWKIICFVGFLASLALLFFYVWQVNDLTKGSYLLGSYEKKISSLSDENKNLQVSFAEDSFLGQAMSQAVGLNFQPVESVKYVPIPDNSVATTVK